LIGAARLRLRVACVGPFSRQLSELPRGRTCFNVRPQEIGGRSSHLPAGLNPVECAGDPDTDAQ
jgi:hypothetical protein